MSQKFSKTRTTYRASTHPKWQKNPKQSGVLEIPISIITTPAPTFADLCVMHDKLAAFHRTCSTTEDTLAFMQALNREISRCRTKSWMLKPNETPTQHAYIDPDQVKQLEGILKPETLRRTFISINALMHEIQKDVTQLLN
jgi:hypothetical protein